MKLSNKSTDTHEVSTRRFSKTPLIMTSIYIASTVIPLSLLLFFFYGITPTTFALLATFTPVSGLISWFVFSSLLKSHDKQRTEMEAKHKELIIQKEIAEATAKSRSEFLSTMSHEIRTPMNGVIGMAHILLNDNPRAEQIPHLKILNFSAQNLLALINDILDYNKLESGKLNFETTDFSLKDTINSITHALKIKAKENNNTLTVNMHNDIPTYIKGDPTRLSQVLNNLMSNAIKFTENGQVTLDIALNTKTEDQISLDFAVTDTGIGIPEDKLEHIFESFTQACSSTTRKFGGTGLGLAITKKILAHQNSEIHVKSTVGKGTTFYFTLNFGTSNIEENIEVQIEEKLKDLTGTKVLLVEDNKINQLIANRFLAKWGIKYDVAENGAIALEKVKDNDYDVVLMDLQMPEMDGYTATAKIRNLDDKKYKKLPIIALTASAMLEERKRVYTVGMNDYLTKPFKPKELHNTITRHLKVA